MTNPRKLKSEEFGDSPETIRAVYPEFAARLKDRRDEILPMKNSARRNLDEQVMTTPGDEADASVIDNSADYFLRLTNSHQRELLEIGEALDRIDRNVYGICESCQSSIALARLRRLPTARLCIDCQAAAERGVLRQFAHR